MFRRFNDLPGLTDQIEVLLSTLPLTNSSADPKIAANTLALEYAADSSITRGVVYSYHVITCLADSDVAAITGRNRLLCAN